MVHRSAKPLLFCDIDGVLSLWGFPMDECPTGNWRTVEGIAHFLSTPAASHLQALEEDFEIVWCSGWEEKANEHLPHLLGVGPYPHVQLDRGSPGTSVAGHWKIEAVDALAAGRPLAWIDDAFNEACHAWARARDSLTLLVPTEPHSGLGDPEADALRAFAQQVSPR